MSRPRTVAYDDQQLFRLELEEVGDRERPYEFVRRVGAVTVLPIIYQHPAAPQVLAVHNDHLYYGASVELPGGNLDGGFDDPEDPTEAALRELREETGYGYPLPSDRNISTFALRRLSRTIEYARYLAVARGVTYIGGEDDNPHEVVKPQPVSVDEYIDPMIRLDRGEMHPEVNAAFARANMIVGRDAVIGWLVGDDVPGAAEVPAAFHPWLLPVA